MSIKLVFLFAIAATARGLPAIKSFENVSNDLQELQTATVADKSYFEEIFVADDETGIATMIFQDKNDIENNTPVRQTAPAPAAVNRYFEEFFVPNDETGIATMIFQDSNDMENNTPVRQKRRAKKCKWIYMRNPLGRIVRIQRCH